MAPRTETLSLSGRTDTAIVGDLFRLHGIDDTPTNRCRLLDAYLNHLPACLETRRGQVLPGVRALLDELRQRDDVAVGLLTGNVRAGARVKLGHFGLFDYFAFGGFGDRHVDRDGGSRAACRVRTRTAGGCRASASGRRYTAGHPLRAHRAQQLRGSATVARCGRTRLAPRSVAGRYPTPSALLAAAALRTIPMAADCNRPLRYSLLCGFDRRWRSKANARHDHGNGGHPSRTMSEISP
jgi:hypothetical protein